MLNNHLKARLKESLAYLIDIHKDEFKDYYLTWQNSLLQIEANRKISSFFYSLNSLLAHSTTSGKVGSDIALLASYIDALPAEPAWNKNNNLESNLHFSNFVEDNLHQDEFIRSQLQKQYILFDLPANADIRAPEAGAAMKLKSLVNDAIQWIATVDGSYYGEMSELLCEIFLLKSAFLKAGSSFDLFGMVYINTDNAKQSLINMVDLLIHETAHYYLYCLSIDDPLVLNDYKESYFSPIKGRNRPMIGIYHAAFVLFRVLQFLSLLESQPQNSFFANYYSESKQEIMEMKNKYTKIVAESLETVMKYGQLTELGQELMVETEKNFRILN